MRISFLSVLVFGVVSVMAQQEKDVIVESYKDLTSSVKINDIFVDQNNTKWLATDQGMIKLVSIQSKPEIFNNDHSFVAITGLTDGEIMGVTQDNKLMDLNGRAFDIDDLGDLTITSIEQHEGLVYLGTNQGLLTFNPKLNKLGKRYNMENSKMPNNTVNMLFNDSRDQLWVGTDGGLVKIKKGKIKSVDEKKQKFWAASETKEGLWVLSNEELWLLDYLESDRFERWRPAALKKGLSQGQALALTTDSRGRLYIASENLVQFDPYTDQTTIINENFGFTSKNTNALLLDKNDDLWVSTEDKGLFRVDVIEGEADRLSAVAFVGKSINCNGEKTGEVELKINGGKIPYSVLWNTSTGNRDQITLSNLAAGTYTASITDADGTHYTASVQLDQPDPIVITEVFNQRISTIGKKDGELKVAVSGGVTPYTLRWSNGKRNTTELDGLAYGDHTLTATDAQKCQTEATFAIGKSKVLAQLDINKVEVGQTLRIEQLFFKADSVDVEEDSYPVLDEIYDFLTLNDNVVVEIGGHTNGLPNHEYCDNLSSARAKNVAQYLYQKGISEDQVSFKGYGKRQPIATNQTSQGRKRNQRVELKIVDIKGS